MDKNKSIVTIRNEIMKLNDKLNTYCLHTKADSLGYSKYYGGDIHVCQNCGKLFISENINDLLED